MAGPNVQRDRAARVYSQRAPASKKPQGSKPTPVVRTSQPNLAPKLIGGGTPKPANPKVLDLPARGAANRAPAASVKPKDTGKDTNSSSPPKNDKVKPNKTIVAERAFRDAKAAKGEKFDRAAYRASLKGGSTATGGGKVTTGGTGKTTTSRGSTAPKAKAKSSEKMGTVADMRAQANKNKVAVAKTKKYQASLTPEQKKENQTAAPGAWGSPEYEKEKKKGSQTESQSQASAHTSNSTSEAVTPPVTPPKAETELEAARRKRKEAEAAAGK